MGGTSSRQNDGSAYEGEHFSSLIQPASKGPRSTPEKASGIDPRARILRMISFQDLWDTFLCGTFNSFALTPAEMQSILGDSIPNNSTSFSKESFETAIKDYIALVEILSEKDSSKSFDLLAVCSSILLLSSISLEMKIDQLFYWITLNPEMTEFGYEEFLVAMRSFERGLSHGFGVVACSEGFVKEVAAQWLAIADPQRKGLADANTHVSAKNFFDFCVNRQFVVRRLLEAMPSLPVLEDKNLELQEVTDAVDLYKEPGGGDEWMANPAWKKTADRMVTKAVRDRYVNAKPSSNLELEWVHGYRGFDCRNNLLYADINGHQIVYSAAALGIVLDQHDGQQRNKKQHFFSEHGDDIICLTSVNLTGSDNTCLIASGEIGKSPAIYLYSWNSNDKVFQSLACLKGFHTKGVAQLAFSADGSRLFSIGVEYSIAVYDTKSNSKNFGKMISSSQGPKDRICHVCALGNSGRYLSCGEKHAIMWSLDGNNILKQDLVKLGSNKNKIFLSTTNITGGGALMATSDGEFFFVSGNTCTAATIRKGAFHGHEKSAINALWSNEVGDMLVSGDKDGHIVVWKVPSANNMEAVFEFDLTGYHISSFADGLIAPAAGGSAKGKIDNIKATTTPPPAIRAICMDAQCRKLLIGTQTCEIVECSLPDGVVFSPSMVATPQLTVQGENLVSGHYRDEVWGLAVRPITPENRAEGTQYATVGDDGFLRIWSLQQHQVLLCVDLKYVSRTCAYSPDGLYLAVGFGGGSKKTKTKAKEDGMVKIFRIDKASGSGAINLIQVSEIKEAKQWVSVLRFSPDGSTLAVGARDNSIYLYSVANQYKRKAKFSKHNAGINQIDFTADGRYLQSCCSAYEILFSDTSNGAQLTDGATKLLESEWHTWTCSLGWSVIGIWSGSMDGSDINNVDRSPSKKYIATCDDFGYVNLFRYPCIQDKGADHNKYNGHSSHVTCVRWASVYNGSPTASFKPIKSDDYLISTGGEDKCVFQWRHTDTGDDRPNANASAGADLKAGAEEADEMGIDEIGLPSGGDEFMAVKPYLGAIVAPSAWKTPNPQRLPPYQAALGEFCNQHRALNELIETSGGAPIRNAGEIYSDIIQSADNVLQRLLESGSVDHSLPNNDDLELEWIYGYNGYDCRNNIVYISAPGTSSSSPRYIIYHAAALGIMLDVDQKKQRYFRGHNDDITAMCWFEKVSSTDAAGGGGSGNVVEQTLIATGQIGMGNVYVWEAPSLQTLSVLATRQKTVLLLAFSADGRYVVSFGEDQSVVVSDWKSQTILTNAKADGGRMFDLAILRTVDGKATPNTQFIAVGDKSLKLWTVNGRNVSSTKFTAGKFTSTQQFLSCVEMAATFYVGCESGDVYIIPGNGKEVKDAFPHNPSGSGTAAAGGGGKKGKNSKGGSAVTAMTTAFKNGHRYLVSGAKDGTISIWNADMVQAIPKPTHIFTFDILTVFPSILAKQIQSININTTVSAIGEGQLLLAIGTRGCDIIEILCNLSAQTAVLYQDRSRLTLGGVIMQGHCNDELWGIATHPTKPEFCSVGDDKSLRFWDLTTRVMKKCVPLGHISRTCCYNHDGSLLALGFGGRVGRGKETGGGMVRLYRVALESSEGAVKVCERQDAKQWISDVKFSPDGTSLVAGAHDCKIYIYNVNLAATGKELTLRCTFMKHAAVINHLDLSLDGRFMQSNCSGYELLFCDITNGKQITSPQEVKDVKWHTWTCTLGWPVQGIWAPGLDGSDINMVSRSHSGHLLATSDDNGKVNLYRYPTLDPKEAKCLTFTGHSSHVMNVQWTAGDECLISAGGNDKCLFQWRHKMAEMSMNSNNSGNGMTLSQKRSNNQQSSKSVRMAAEDYDDDTASVTSDTSNMSMVSNSSTVGGDSSGNALDFLMDGGPSGGDESGAVKPWVGAVKPPKHPPAYSDKAPAVDTRLSWVHGYASSLSNCRPNVFYNLSGQLVYPAAALAVLLDRGASTQAVASASAAASGLKVDRSQWQQCYFEGHDDDVTCLTMSRDRRFVATGQIASKAMKGKASVIVWDALQGRLLSRMDACHQRGVYSVAFSPDNQQLISVGMDDSYTHILWADMGGSWSRVQQLSTAKGDRIPTVVLRWVHNQHDMVKKNEFHFISGGNKVLSLWKVEGSTLTKKQARVGKKTNSQSAMTTYTSLGNFHAKEGWKLCLGTANGDILTLEERELQLGVEKAHAKAIYSMAESEDGTFIITGGKDCFIKIWNQQLQLISSFDLNAASSVDIFDASVLSIDILPMSVSLSTSSANASASSGNGSNSNPFNTMTFLCGTGGGDIIEFAVPATQSGSKALSSSSAASSSAAEDGGNSSGNVPSRNFDLMKSVLSQVMDSHYKGELWGLSPHPLNPDVFATVGDDRILRVWSIAQRRCLSAVSLARAARVIAWHPSGQVLAVGLEEDRKANQKLKKGGSSSSGGKTAGKGKKSKNTAATADNEGGSGGGGDEGNPYVADNDDSSNGKQQQQGEPTVDETGGVRIYSYHESSAAADGLHLQATLHLRASGCFPKTHPQGTFTSVSDMKFSPSGDMLFVGGHDMTIHRYNVPAVVVAGGGGGGDNNHSLSAPGAWSDWTEALARSEHDFQKHSSAITHFDVSLDGKYIQSNDLACELLFYDIAAKKQELSATKMAEYHGRIDTTTTSGDGEDGDALALKRWLTQNTVFGWAVQGMWPANSYDSSEINSVDRSVSEKYLATGEDSGQIRLLRFPSVIPSSKSVVLRGHSSHVTCVRWTLDDKLISVGGNDKCVFVWEVSEK